MSENIEELRTEFASEVITRASKCGNNADMVRQLEKDFRCELIGEGSTRRVYASPLGVCVKIQREDIWADPLTDAELQERGGDEYLLKLAWRRRTANLAEMIFAAAHPLLMPRQYGYLGSFGPTQSHPSVIIAETCKPLNHYLPGDGNGIKTEDMGIDKEGHLWIFDSRLTPEKKPASLSPYREMTGTPEPEVWLGNIGATAGGKYVFIDRSDHGDVSPLLDQWTLTPSAPTLEFSKSMFLRYRKALGTKKGDLIWEKEADQAA